jgi:hypothetical protein
MTEGEVRLKRREGPDFGLRKCTPGALRRSRYDRRQNPLDAVLGPRFGLGKRTPGALRRSRYDRRRNPLDVALGPRFGLGKRTPGALRRSRYDRSLKAPIWLSYRSIRGDAIGLAATGGIARRHFVLIRLGDSSVRKRRKDSVTGRRQRYS